MVLNLESNINQKHFMLQDSQNWRQVTKQWDSQIRSWNDHRYVWYKLEMKSVFISFPYAEEPAVKYVLMHSLPEENF